MHTVAIFFGQYKRLLAVTAVVMAGILSIIGSGGGGNGTPSGIPYVGNTNPAVITTTNAARLVGYVIGTSEVSDIIVGPAVAIVSNPPGAREGSSTTGLVHRLNIYLHETLAKVDLQPSGLSHVLIGITVDETSPCVDGGTLRLSGTLNDDGTGVLTATYNNCKSGENTLNGEGVIRIDKFDLSYFIITDSTFSSNLLTLTSPSRSISISGSLRDQVNIATNTETMTVGTMVSRDNLSGEMQKVENNVIVDVFDNLLSPSTYTESAMGRLYDSIDGYVDFSTAIALEFGSINQPFPDNGQLLFTGAGNARIRLTATSAVLTMLELDLNADSSYETSAVLNWTNIGGPISADLGDTDHDGMHNSWETTYGLDPANPDDANLDKDNDGFTNLQEYQAGTDPDNANSTPPTADLALTKTVTPGYLVTGETFSYTINAYNQGPSDATDVVVTDTLPAGLTLVSVSPSVGTCGGSSTVTCNLGTLASGWSGWITLSVMASTEGDYVNTASVTSTTYDGNALNNSATATATVVPPSADLWISNTDNPDPVPVDGTLTYSISVSNNGPTVAPDVIVTDDLPAGFMLLSANPSIGTCVGSTTVTCNLGTISSGWSQSITLSVTPSLSGVYHNTATVSSSAAEIDSSNNSVTITTTVGTSSGSLQALIDAATNGDTVPVPSGLYVGGIDFGGKNITLISTSGPASTIIHGNNGTAVKMGPGGTISGFTITGARASFGAGIEVAGVGSTISGNIFDGNTEDSGGYGAAIGGNSASPVIERNLFRYNSCDSQFLSGVVAFINGSSPTIENNVFENNPCRGINLTLPNDNTPLVINNTLVGNAVAIRVDRRVTQITLVYRNNIINQNGIGLQIEFGTEADNPVWQNNLVYGNTIDYQGIADQTGLNMNISADPLFAGAPTSDYHLQLGSPAIDTGSALDAPSIDFDGTPRPLDGNGDTVPAFDIGAFEFSP